MARTTTEIEGDLAIVADEIDTAAHACGLAAARFAETGSVVDLRARMVARDVLQLLIDKRRLLEDEWTEQHVEDVLRRPHRWKDDQQLLSTVDDFMREVAEVKRRKLVRSAATPWPGRVQLFRGGS